MRSETPRIAARQRKSTAFLELCALNARRTWHLRRQVDLVMRWVRAMRPEMH